LEILCRRFWSGSTSACFRETDRQTLFNSIQRLFDRLDEWSQRLKQIAETGTDCSELLESAAGMLQNPVWLCDENWHTVARAERFFSDLDADFLKESYKMLDTKCRGRMDRQPFHAGDAEGAELLCVGFSAGGARFFLLCAAKERPFYGSDEIVFENLGGYVKLMLSEHKISVRALRQNRQNDLIEQYLRELLDQTSAEIDSTRALERLGWGGEAGYMVLALETASGDMRAERVHAVCDRLERALNDCCAFAYPPVIVAVVRTAGPEEAGVLKALAEFAAKNALRVGVSAACKGFAFLQQRLFQAKFALRSSAGGEGIYEFSAVADTYIFQRSVAELPPELLCMPPMLHMAEYDREHGTNYIETLERYVKNRFNAVKTAGELFIHRSTFLYRLERIHSQFGLDLEGEQSAPLHFAISLRIASKLANQKELRNRSFLQWGQTVGSQTLKRGKSAELTCLSRAFSTMDTVIRRPSANLRPAARRPVRRTKGRCSARRAVPRRAGFWKWRACGCR
jgi:hypothetical protein